MARFAITGSTLGVSVLPDLPVNVKAVGLNGKVTVTLLGATTGYNRPTKIHVVLVPIGTDLTASAESLLALGPNGVIDCPGPGLGLDIDVDIQLQLPLPSGSHTAVAVCEFAS